jgi:hypothetical protein
MANTRPPSYGVLSSPLTYLSVWNLLAKNFNNRLVHVVYLRAHKVRFIRSWPVNQQISLLSLLTRGLGLRTGEENW